MRISCSAESQSADVRIDAHKEAQELLRKLGFLVNRIDVEDSNENLEDIAFQIEGIEANLNRSQDETQASIDRTIEFGYDPY